MTTSKTIAGLIDPTLVALAAGMLLNIGSFPALAEKVSCDSALIFVSGILLFVAGLAVVRVHNRWTNGWPMLVTILGHKTRNVIFGVISVDLSVPRRCPVYPLTTDIRTNAGFRRFGPPTDIVSRADSRF
jgi:hypothetical protein